MLHPSMMDRVAGINRVFGKFSRNRFIESNGNKPMLPVALGELDI